MTSHINLNYLLSLQVIIPIKLSVCNPARNYLRNSRMCRRLNKKRKVCKLACAGCEREASGLAQMHNRRLVRGHAWAWFVVGLGVA